MKHLTLLLIVFVLFSCTNKKIATKKKMYTIQFQNQINGKINDKGVIITNDYFIFITFANNYKKTVKKLLKYSETTNKKPGIVFIIENEMDFKLISPFLSNTKNNNIRVWAITNDFILYDWIWLK